MKTRKDYSKSPAPRFDALQDLIEFLGDRWPRCNGHLKAVTSPDQFENWAGFAGVEGAPVEAWYDHIHGEGAWVIAGGTSQFCDGMAIKPMTIRRAFTRDLIDNLTNVLSSLAEESTIVQDHPLASLSTDDFAFVEEWLQDTLERVERDNSEEDEILFTRFVKQIEHKLIKRMTEKVLEQIGALGNDYHTISYILHGLNKDQLFKVIDFLNSYKKPLED